MSERVRSGVVWIISGLFLLGYAGLGLIGAHIPGVEELVTFAESQTGPWLLIAAAVSMFVEGLYVVGNVLPGSTLVLMLAMLASFGSPATFLATIGAVFLGWCLAGIINIWIGTRLRSGVHHIPPPGHDRYLTTWYPTFRANHEVAEVVRGVAPTTVWWSSLRVKALACLGAGAYALILPHFFDLKDASNEQGFATVLVIGIICLAVGVRLVTQKE